MVRVKKGPGFRVRVYVEYLLSILSYGLGYHGVGFNYILGEGVHSARGYFDLFVPPSFYEV